MSVKGSRYGQAGKLIKEAQEYDFSSDDKLGAFCKYLTCVKHIAEFLSDDAAAHRDMLLLNRNGAKSVLVMAKKCLERAEDIFIDVIDNVPAVAVNQPPPLPSRNVSNVSSSSDECKLSNGTEQSPTVTRLHSVSPMEEAWVKNQKLMSVYQEHLKKRASSLLPQDCNRLNLAMWKKIEENNKIARMKEKALQQKLHERTSRMNKVPKVKTQLMVEQSVKEICELITVYETGKGNFTALKHSLQQHPDDHTHLYNLVNEVLSTGEHPLSKLLAECQFNVCESIKPWAVATAKGGNFPAMTILPVVCRRNNPLPSVTVASSNGTRSSHSYSSASNALNECSYSLPAVVSDSQTVTNLTAVTANIRNSTISQYDEEEDFVTSDVFMAVTGDTAQGNPVTDQPAVVNDQPAVVDDQPTVVDDQPTVVDDQPTVVDDLKESNGTQAGGEATLTANDKESLNNDQQPSVSDVESSVNDEAAYFVLEKPSKLVTNSDSSVSSNIANSVSTPAYEEIDEATVKKRAPSPLPYEIPSVSRQESCDAYYSNIGSPEASGYTLLSQWTRCKPEDDYTQLDPTTIISKTDTCLYPQLECSVHLGKREVLEPLSEKVCVSIKDIVKEIHLYLDKMEQVFVTMYQGINVESNKETCRDLVEKIFFPPIWPNLMQIYRCSNYRQEVALALNMKHHVNALPADLSIREQFQLLGSASLPYSAAIEELEKIQEANSPSPKLEILVTMSRRICQAIEEYHSEKGQPHADSSVGVDDMLPIFSYIILRSGLPQMVSECAIMDEFIQEGYLMGEEGFCLTSFQTALRYLTMMSS